MLSSLPISINELSHFSDTEQIIVFEPTYKDKYIFRNLVSKCQLLIFKSVTTDFE